MSNPYEGDPYQENSGQPEGGNQYGGSPYGQDPYGQNAYWQGQDAYGQNPYGQSQNAYGQNPYGQNPYGGYGTMAQPHPQGTTVLVLGILGLVVCFICGIVAAVMGTTALREIDANPSAYNNRQTLVAGRILGLIGAGLQVLGIIGVIATGVAGQSGNY